MGKKHDDDGGFLPRQRHEEGEVGEDAGPLMNGGVEDGDDRSKGRDEGLDRSFGEDISDGVGTSAPGSSQR